MRSASVFSTLTVGMLLLGGCRVGASAQGEYQDITMVLQPITSVRVSGSLGLRLHVGATTSVHRTVHYDGTDPGKDTWRVEGSELVIEGCRLRNCYLDYDVTVPASSTLSGSVGSGDADVAGLAAVDLVVRSSQASVRHIAGATTLRAESSAARVSDVAGPATLTVASGDLRADGLRAPTTVEVRSGEATVAMASAQDVSAQVASGTIDLTVPHDSYRVQKQADSGEVTSAVPDDPAGAHRLQLRASAGAISVQYG